MSKKKKETLKNIKPKKKLNSGFYLEYLERAHLSGIVLEDILAEHSVYEQHSAIKMKVDQILEQCADLYQLAGYLMHKKCEEEENADTK
jgi:Fe-S cluster assembly ATPase SufC